MKNYLKFWKYLLRFKGQLTIYVLCNVISVLFSVISLGMLGPFLLILFGKKEGLSQKPVFHFSADGFSDQINYLITHIKDTSGYGFALLFIVSVVVATVLLKNVFLYIAIYIFTPLRTAIISRLRKDLYNKILQLPVSYFTDKRKGDIFSRMSNDMTDIEWSLYGTMEGFVRDPLTILIFLSILIAISPKLSLFMLLLLPFTGFIIGRVGRSLKKQSTKVAEITGNMMSQLDETLSGMRVVKAFNAENALRNNFLSINHLLNTVRNKINQRRDLASPLSETLGVVVLCGILWLGGDMVFAGDLKSENFITYIVIFTQIINPAKALSTNFYNMRKGSAAIERINEILDAPLVIIEPEDPKPINSFNHSIELKNVSFAYEDAVILKNINLKIEKGKMVALVGSSGAGKSTLADLVPRFHDVTSGELLIDGNNIKDYSLHELRNLMGIVTQEPILFNDTIASNIALGIDNASAKDIEQAARIANAHNFIINKEEGYNTNIGDRGNKLSGGERQRLTIARALLKNPPILILDEATSSLDTESERLVQDAINHLMQDRTSIVIAHRLSTIRHADEIIVLQKGEIVERGTHDSLIAQNGFYKRLVEMQEVK